VLAALENHRAQNNFFFADLLVTDVVAQTSLLLVCGAESLLRHIDYPKVERGIYELEGVVSRKKQLLPCLTHCLAKVQE